MANTLADLTLNLKTKTVELEKGLSQANRSLDKFGKGAQASGGKVGGMVKGIGENLKSAIPMIGAFFGAFAFAALIKGFASATKELLAYVDRLNDLSDITGMSKDAIQEWQFVAKIAGVETEAVTKATEGLIRKITGLNEESGRAHAQMKLLGVEFKTAGGEIKNADDIMDDTLYKLADMDNALERNAIGSQLFGGAWKDLAPILGRGSEGIEDLRKEARDLGLILSDETIVESERLREASVRLAASWEVIRREGTSKLIPLLSSLAEGYSDLIKYGRKAGEELSWVWASQTLSGWDKFTAQANLATGGLLWTERGAKAVNKAYTELEPVITAMANETKKEAEEINKRNKALEESTDKQKEANGLIPSIEKKIKALAEEQRNAWDPSVIADYTKQIEQLKGELDRLTKASDVAAEVTTESILGELDKRTFDDINALLAESEKDKTISPSITADYSEFLTTQEAFVLKFIELNKSAEESLVSLGASMALLVTDQLVTLGDSLLEGADNFEEFGDKLRQSVKSIIGTLLAEAVAMMITNAIKSASALGPAALLIAPALGKLAGGVAKTLFNSMIPKFAEGGIVSGPTIGMMGEYSNVRSNPEVIAPLDRLKTMLAQEPISGEVKFVIEQDKLVGILERYNKKQLYF